MEHLRERRRLRHSISMPFIVSMVIPLIILDFWTELYHRVSFPLYGIACIERGRYIKIDRHKLKYLTFWQKVFCAYCGYANGLAKYLTEIAAATEKYWCGIRHAEDKNFLEPVHHKNFAEYGNKEDLDKKYRS